MKKRLGKTQTLKNNNILNKLIHSGYLFILTLLFLIFAGLTIVSFLSTCVIDVDTPSREVVVFLWDNVLTNIIGLLIALGIFIFIEKTGQKIIEKINLKFVFIAVALFVTALGMIWVFSVNSVPRADSRWVVAAATNAMNGNYEIFHEAYFKLFPFQLGYAALLEIMVGIVGEGNYGALAAMNVIFLVAGYGAVTLITDAIFRNKKITFYCIMLLGLSVQPILFCTFIYGNVLGMTASLWAIYFIIKLFDTSKKRFGILTSLMLALAVVAKPNNWIVVVAICIIVILHILKTKKFRMFIYIILFILLPMFSINSIIDSYSARSGADFGSGAPQTAWLAMGFQESARAPGWFNGYSFTVLKDNDFDTEAAKEQTIVDLKSRIQVFREDPAYALKFFTKKAVSQWNEPEFQSIWASEVRNDDNLIPDFVESIYTGTGRKVLHGYMNQHMQVVYFTLSVGLLFGIISLIKKKEDNENGGNFREAFCLLPLVILGGFLYHLLFEAKAQYALVYLPMMIPYCAFGIERLAKKINII